MTTRPSVSKNMIDRLAPPLQRALWELGWQGLRDNQIAALPLILDTLDDVVISATTYRWQDRSRFFAAAHPLVARPSGKWQRQ